MTSRWLTPTGGPLGTAKAKSWHIVKQLYTALLPSHQWILVILAHIVSTIASFITNLYVTGWNHKKDVYAKIFIGPKELLKISFSLDTPVTKFAILKEMTVILPSSMVIVDKPMLYGPAPTAVCAAMVIVYTVNGSSESTIKFVDEVKNCIVMPLSTFVTFTKYPVIGPLRSAAIGGSHVAMSALEFMLLMLMLTGGFEGAVEML